ncbi:unnamed protein product [Ixodes hexagonus]
MAQAASSGRRDAELDDDDRDPSPEALDPAEEPASSPEPKCTTVQTRSRSQILHVTPSRLPYMAVCTVGVLMVLVGAAVTTYKLQSGTVLVALFNRSITLLRPAPNVTADDDVSKHLVKHERKTISTDTSCKSDVCSWTANYLRGKVNVSVSACNDFYGYVCSRNWYAKDLDIQSRPYRERSVGMMMMDVEKFFRDYLKENEERYHKYPGVFLHQAISLLPKCQSEEKNDKNLTSLKGLLEEYNLGSWPYRKAPRGVTIVKISAFVDRDLGVFPFAKVFLKKPFEDDRGYTVHIDKPSSALKRHQLAFLDESVENYTQKVKLALTLFDKKLDVTEQADAIAVLEKKLLSVMTVTRFVEFQDRVKKVGQLARKGKWDWKEYFTILFQDIETFDNEKPVAVMNQEYLTKMEAVLNETDTVTLLNYIGYRLVVHVSPLLAKVASPLLRLSHDNYMEFVPDRLQACMHLLERVYKHGMRFFARMTFSKNNSTLLLKHYDYSMANVESQLKSSMAERLLSSSSWLDRAAIGIGVDKLENMRLIFLGSTDDINTIANYYNFNAQPLDPSRLLESFREVQAGTMNVYWETKPPKDDLDARYDHTGFSPGYEYFFGRNMLFIPHGNVAFLNDITKAIDPVLYPIILANPVRGIFAAVDKRGATVDHNLAVATWWNTDELSKYSQLELCYQDQYYVEIRDLVGDNFEARIRLEENIADNAIIAPLYDLYMKTLTMQGQSLDKLKVTLDVGEVNLEQLFFINYAVGICDNPSREAWVRKIKYGEIPGRLRVNIPLMNFERFSTAFNCAVGSPMNPTRKCTIW